jgi:hypothetical protein
MNRLNRKYNIGIVHPWEYDWKGQVDQVAKLNHQGESIQRIDAGKVIGLAWALEDAQDEREAVGMRLSDTVRERDCWEHSAKVAWKSVGILVASLEEARIKGHRDCDDGWYSCPKSEGYIKHCNDDDDMGCDCGMDTHNAKIDTALASVQKLHGVE